MTKQEYSDFVNEVMNGVIAYGDARVHIEKASTMGIAVYNAGLGEAISNIRRAVESLEEFVEDD